MLIIKIPSNHLNERKYIIDEILGSFLRLKYEVIVDCEVSDYHIIIDNSKSLIIKDHFFNRFEDDLSYIDIINIPEKVIKFKNDILLDDEIPIIYGTNELVITDKNIICGIDIFASAFFMLTRWEECCIKVRDKHNRFPATSSLAYKNDFIDLPIVNMYVEILWNLLKQLGIKQGRKKNNYELVLSHDVDSLLFWTNLKQLSRICIGDIIKRKKFKLPLNRIYEYSLVKLKMRNDPYDTFDWLMQKSESINLKSRFYFMSGGITNYDNRYKLDDKKCLDLIKKISNRGHVIGFHPSYNSYNNQQQFYNEKLILEKTVGHKIYEGRHHYLRFEVPFTWQMWDDNKMMIDSTCGYADHEGFRCGTGDEFTVFNVLTRKKLSLKERPLIFMDDNHYTYNREITQSISITKVERLFAISKKYNSKMTVLFHNSIFATSGNVNFYDLYERILGCLYE